MEDAYDHMEFCGQELTFIIIATEYAISLHCLTTATSVAGERGL